MVPRALPRSLAKGIPGRGSALRGHAWAPSKQAVLKKKEGLCYLFSSKNQLLLNSCFSSQASPSLCVQQSTRLMNSFPFAWHPERRSGPAWCQAQVLMGLNL